MADRRFTTLHIGGKGESVQDYGVLEAQAQQRIDQQQLAQQQANQQASARLALDRDRAAMAQSQFVQNLRQRQAEQEALAARSQGQMDMQREMATQNQAAQMDRLRESLGLQREMGDRKYGEMEASRLQRGKLAHLKDETSRRGQDLTYDAALDQLGLGYDRLDSSEGIAKKDRDLRTLLAKNAEKAAGNRHKERMGQFKVEDKRAIDRLVSDKADRDLRRQIAFGRDKNGRLSSKERGRRDAANQRKEILQGQKAQQVVKAFENLKIDFNQRLTKKDVDKISKFLVKQKSLWGEDTVNKALGPLLETGRETAHQRLDEEYGGHYRRKGSEKPSWVDALKGLYAEGIRNVGAATPIGLAFSAKSGQDVVREGRTLIQELANISPAERVPYSRAKGSVRKAYPEYWAEKYKKGN